MKPPQEKLSQIKTIRVTPTMQRLLQHIPDSYLRVAIQEAADNLDERKLSRMQQRVLAWIAEHGPCSDNQGIAGTGLLNGYRARRVELFRKRLIEACGERDGSQLWRVK